MRTDLEQQLYTKYPRIFRKTVERNYHCSLDVGDGWYNIVNSLLRCIKSHSRFNTQTRWYARQQNRNGKNIIMPAKTPLVQVVQVKEKFGSLRFYVINSDSTILNYIDMAEAMSAVTCEDCGAPGSLRRKGWISCLCDACEKIRQTRKNND